MAIVRYFTLLKLLSSGMQTMRTAGLLYIKDRKLLLAFSKNKRAYYLPGGKVDPNEDTISALIREIKEELNVELNSSDLHYHTHIRSLAYGEREPIEMQQDCFLCTTPIQPSSSGEIEDPFFLLFTDLLS